MGGQEGAGSGAHRCEILVLLVGANPLPNYLAAAVLRPRRVVLVFSGETTGPRDRLAAELAGRLGGGPWGAAPELHRRDQGDGGACPRRPW